MSKGAFQTSREIFANPIWHDIPKFRIFFYIYGNAVFSKDGALVGGMELKRGQFLRSYRNLREDLEYIENRSIKRYSLSVIKRKVDELVEENRLKIEDTELGTLFTVVNYEKYQGFEHYEKDNLERRRNRERTEKEQGWNNNKNVKNDKEGIYSRKLVYDDIHFSLAEFFYQQILKNNPQYKKPNLEKWANEIRLMMERDGRTAEQIKYLMQWVQQDEFEMVNVLSPSKLRKRFDQLVLKVKQEKNKQPKRERQPKINVSEPEDWQEEMARIIEGR